MRYKATLIKPVPDVPSAEGIMPRPVERYSNFRAGLEAEMAALLEGAPEGSEVVVYEVCFMERSRLVRAAVPLVVEAVGA